MPTDFYQTWLSRKVVPSPAQGPYATRFYGVLGYEADLMVNAAAQATGARFIQLAEAGALGYAGDDRLMPQYPAETTEAYRARLLEAWSTWEIAGTAAAITNQLTAMGFTNPAVYWADGAAPPGIAPWPPDSNTANWSRFWVYLAEPWPSWAAWTLTHWGDSDPIITNPQPRRWSALGSDGTPYTWGSTATVQQVATIRDVIQLWKPVHAICAGIYVNFTTEGVTLLWDGT